MPLVDQLRNHLYDGSRHFIDVRSPAEYTRGHIPGATNLPLFSNTERAAVGTAYVQRSREEAVELGLEFVIPRLHYYIEQFKVQGASFKGSHSLSTDSAPPSAALLYCWRGGLRSASLSWFLNENGLGSSTIEGGYKAYRRLVLSDLERPWPFVVIGGYTGSGKTFILHALQAMGKQMLDLEYLANHRGSAFGAFGMQPQHTSEHTMNIVHRAITALDQTQTIFVEDESQHIGSVWLHEPLYHHLRQSPLIEVRIPRDQRVRFLAAEYGAVDTTVLAESFVKIAKPLGGDRLKGALAALAVGDLEKAATMALEHYDKAYAYDLQRRQTQAVRVIEHAEVDPVAIAARILEAR